MLFRMMIGLYARAQQIRAAAGAGAYGRARPVGVRTGWVLMSVLCRLVLMLVRMAVLVWLGLRVGCMVMTMQVGVGHRPEFGSAGQAQTPFVDQLGQHHADVATQAERFRGMHTPRTARRLKRSAHRGRPTRPQRWAMPCSSSISSSGGVNSCPMTTLAAASP